MRASFGIAAESVTAILVAEQAVSAMGGPWRGDGNGVCGWGGVGWGGVGVCDVQIDEQHNE
jgi:hypothetical protein